jgi:hypothetical protein
MDFKEIAGRLTGFSTPVFGVSWNPPESERGIARRVIAFLEDRRVLYNPYHIEIDDQVTSSVLDIRQALTTEIGSLDAQSELAAHLRAMRAACRKYLDDTGPGSHRLDPPPWRGPFEFGFFLQLGELRATVGGHVAAIAVMYGLDVEGDLAEVLPALDSPEDDDTSARV